MGVCCVVFEIDGILFEFLFMFSSCFMLFPTFLEEENFCGGGGGHFLPSFHVIFVFYAISKHVYFWKY